MNLAIFDFDGTLLTKSTLPSLAREWARQGRSRIRLFLVYISVLPVIAKYKLKIIDRKQFKNLAFDKFNRIYKGMSREEIIGFFHRAYPNIKKAFNPAVLNEIETAQQQGYHCVLLSGSYADLLRVTALDLGFETVIGTELEFSNGIFDSRESIPFINGKIKVALLYITFAGKNVNWSGSKCFADSTADIELMKLVGEPVAINPDRGLWAYARDNNWRINNKGAECSPDNSQLN